MKKAWAIIKRLYDYLSVLVAVLVGGALILSLLTYAVSEFTSYRPSLIYRPSGGQLSYKILPHLVEVFGTLFLPSNIPDNTTKPVRATFYASERLPPAFAEQLRKNGMSGKIDKAQTTMVRAELVAPGVEFSDSKQDKPLDREAIPFEWQCRFKDRGTYEVLVRFSVIDPNNTVIPVGEVKQTVQVTTPIGVTHRWAYWAAIIAGAVAFIGGVLAIVGFFRKKETAPAEAHEQPLRQQPLPTAPVAPTPGQVPQSTSGPNPKTPEQTKATTTGNDLLSKAADGGGGQQQ